MIVKNANRLSVSDLATKLGPLLPTGFRKVHWRSWSNGRVTIDMDYVEPPSSELPSECYPTAVYIRVANARERLNGSHGYEYATVDDIKKAGMIPWDKAKIQKWRYTERKDATYNIDAIAAAVTHIDKALVHYEIDVVERQRQEDQRDQDWKELITKISTLKRNFNVGPIQVNTYPSQQSLAVHVGLERLTVAQAREVHTLVRSFKVR